MKKNKIRRIDPINCGCTDCIVGYSIPLDHAEQKHLKALYKGKLQNAAGIDVMVNYYWEFK